MWLVHGTIRYRSRRMSASVNRADRASDEIRFSLNSDMSGGCQICAMCQWKTSPGDGVRVGDGRDAQQHLAVRRLDSSTRRTDDRTADALPLVRPDDVAPDGARPRTRPRPKSSRCFCASGSLEVGGIMISARSFAITLAVISLIAVDELSGAVSGGGGVLSAVRAESTMQSFRSAESKLRTLIDQLRGATMPAGIVKTNGRIEATQVDVAAKYAGRLATVAVNEGDEVTAGQVVARISSPEYEA